MVKRFGTYEKIRKKLKLFEKMIAGKTLTYLLGLVSMSVTKKWGICELVVIMNRVQEMLCDCPTKLNSISGPEYIVYYLLRINKHIKFSFATIHRNTISIYILEYILILSGIYFFA